MIFNYWCLFRFSCVIISLLVFKLLFVKAIEIRSFKKMDIERRRQEAAETRRKPRLIEHDEIPEGIVKASQHFMEEEKEPMRERLLIQTTGRRKRKEVDYSQVV